MSRMERGIYIFRGGERKGQREVEYVTISVVPRVWNILKAERKSMWLNCWLLWTNDIEVGRHFM